MPCQLSEGNRGGPLGRHATEEAATERATKNATDGITAGAEVCASACRVKKPDSLLRCSTVFEDVVKTICTTNCSWSNTKLMVANLCRMFGESCAGDGEAFTFPTFERLAQASEDDLKAAKLGFRARYILELARRVAGGELDLDAWCGETDPDALRSSLLGVKGVGSYAANHLLMLLGHYDRIPCDSVVREYLGVLSKAAQKEVERAAAKRYGHWGRYCFLAYKFERVFRRRNYGPSQKIGNVGQVANLPKTRQIGNLPHVGMLHIYCDGPYVDCEENPAPTHPPVPTLPRIRGVLSAVRSEVNNG